MTKPNILTVDDDPQVSAAVARDLPSRYGPDFRILRASSGAEALEVLGKLALRDQAVALIAADQRMPQMTGTGRSGPVLFANGSGSWQNTDVVEGLESTLVMLGHKLRGGVEIIREYSDNLPAIDVYPGELNQVWTDLIDNAVDAMEGTGTLRVATLSDGAGVTVEIGDTGPGLAPPVAKRAFEAFYTTKDVGKGTGLGLDIARRIVVERHGGSIDFESVPGRTVFRVRLPLIQA